MSAILKVENLNVTLTYRKTSKKLVENVNFEVYRGECLGILGESGSGKSMTVKSILGLLDKNFHVSGSAVFDGHDLLKESKEELRKLRGSRITMVLQNPMTCFDPLYRIGNQMAETFATHTTWNAQEIRSHCLESEPDADLKWRRSFAKIPPPALRWYAPAHYDRYCHGIAARASDR
ncbi:MAG: ATP-binding cassette domain-containing protein [Enterocloster sp.]